MHDTRRACLCACCVCPSSSPRRLGTAPRLGKCARLQPCLHARASRCISWMLTWINEFIRAWDPFFAPMHSCTCTIVVHGVCMPACPRTHFCFACTHSCVCTQANRCLQATTDYYYYICCALSLSRDTKPSLCRVFPHVSMFHSGEYMHQRHVTQAWQPCVTWCSRRLNVTVRVS